MVEISGTFPSEEDFYTLLCVRSDGVASFVDVLAAADLAHVRRRAEALLKEHRSSEKVEVWREGALVEEHARVSA